MLLSDKTIKELCVGRGSDAMLTPFTPESISKLETDHPTTSYGLSSYGYDLRLGNAFKTLKRPENLPGARFIDPTAFDEELLQESWVDDGFVFVVPPHACVLAVTKERIIMPPDVSGVCMQKSTIARSFLEVTVTPLEAGWEGYLTLELHNKTPYPLHLRPGCGIVQLLFYKGDQPCEVPYGARKGKYHNQPAYPVSARSMSDGPVRDITELGILTDRTFARTSNAAKAQLKETIDVLEDHMAGRIQSSAEVDPSKVWEQPYKGKDFRGTIDALAAVGDNIGQSLAAQLNLAEVCATVRELTDEHMNTLVDTWARTNKELLAFGTNVSGHASAESIDETASFLKEAYRSQTKIGAVRRMELPADAILAEDNQVQPTPFSTALAVVRERIKSDEDLAWTWFCNLAVPIKDSLPDDITMIDRRHIANYAAFVLMMHLFNHDMASTEIGKKEQIPTTQCTFENTLTFQQQRVIPLSASADAVVTKAVDEPLAKVALSQPVMAFSDLLGSTDVHVGLPGYIIGTARPAKYKGPLNSIQVRLRPSGHIPAGMGDEYRVSGLVTVDVHGNEYVDALDAALYLQYLVQVANGEVLHSDEVHHALERLNAIFPDSAFTYKLGLRQKVGWYITALTSRLGKLNLYLHENFYNVIPRGTQQPQTA